MQKGENGLRKISKWMLAFSFTASIIMGYYLGATLKDGVNIEECFRFVGPNLMTLSSSFIVTDPNR